MRIVFMGFQSWGHVVLSALLHSRHEVPLVITHPDTDNAYEILWDDSVAELARTTGIRCLTKVNVEDEHSYDEIRACSPDILVSSNWRTWVPPRVYQLAHHGALNVHDSLLPRYGGFAPLNWAVANGEAEVGVTVHFMNELLDLGDIILQRRVVVGPMDNATMLYHRTLPMFPDVILEALDLVESGTVTVRRQDPASATFFHKRSLEDSRINWHRSASEIVNLIRAQSHPYPSAFGYYGPERVEILQASVSDIRYGGTVGRVFRREPNGVAVVCGPNANFGSERGIVLELVRRSDGVELSSGEFFTKMGGYMRSYPL